MFSKLFCTCPEEHFRQHSWKKSKVLYGLRRKKFPSLSQNFLAGLSKLPSTGPGNILSEDFLEITQLTQPKLANHGKKVRILREWFSFHNILRRKLIMGCSSFWVVDTLWCWGRKKGSSGIRGCQWKKLRVDWIPWSDLPDGPWSPSSVSSTHLWWPLLARHWILFSPFYSSSERKPKTQITNIQCKIDFPSFKTFSNVLYIVVVTIEEEATVKAPRASEKSSCWNSAQKLYCGCAVLKNFFIVFSGINN